MKNKRKTGLFLGTTLFKMLPHSKDVYKKITYYCEVMGMSKDKKSAYIYTTQHYFSKSKAISDANLFCKFKKILNPILNDQIIEVKSSDFE